MVEVIASHGNNQLGGDDFDALIENFLLAQLQEEGFIDIPRPAHARIRRAAENTKKQLSSQPFSLIEEEYLLDRDGAPYHFRVELARSQYEEMISPLLDETMDAIHLVLKNAGLIATAIDEILLVGGSTRTPLVQKRLELEFGMAPRFEVDPDLCVAAGAALQAAMINGAEIRAVLVDVTPSAKRLKSEGYLMNNCCRDYMDQCAGLAYCLFSICSRSGERLATLGLAYDEDYWHFDQCFGPANTEVLEENRTYIDEDGEFQEEIYATDLYYVAQEVARLMNSNGWQ